MRKSVIAHLARLSSPLFTPHADKVADKQNNQYQIDRNGNASLVEILPAIHEYQAKI